MLKTNIVAVWIWQHTQPWHWRSLRVTIMMSVDQLQIMAAKMLIGLHAAEEVYNRVQKELAPG